MANEKLVNRENLKAFRQANDNRYAKPDGNYPTLTVGLADNFTPYSEDSGAEQENPFISNGTGTNNNTEIVTVGDYGLFKEKQGNSVVVNQLAHDPTFTNTDNWEVNTSLCSKTVSSNVLTMTCTTTGGNLAYYLQNSQDTISFNTSHKYLMFFTIKASTSLQLRVRNPITTSYFNLTTTKKTFFAIESGVDDLSKVRLQVYQMSVGDYVEFSDVYCFDITQMFNGDIPQDLLDNPSHFSWYYNGSLAYNTGSLENANGVKLVSTGRNIYNPNATYNVVIPNKPFFASKTTTITYYDKDKNSIGTESVSAGNTFTTPSNCVFISSSVSAITITPYYTDQEGGEGYLDNNVPIEYPYEEPYVVDTGSEVLRKAGSVKDYKEPNGTIHRLVGTDTVQSIDIAATDETYTNIVYYRFRKPDDSATKGNVTKYGLMTSKYEVSYLSGTWDSADKIGKIFYTAAYNWFWVGFTLGTTLAQAQTALTGMEVYYELATPTTEQGTPFAENLPINDYGMLYWLDSNDELVGIPQGAKIFYPTNYKGFVDDVYMRTNGDASDLVVQSELSAEETERSNQDTILQNAIGGTLRQCLCVKENLDFDNTNVVDLGSLSWVYSAPYMYSVDIASLVSKPSDNYTLAKVISTQFKTLTGRNISVDGLYGIAIDNAGYIRVAYSGMSTDTTTFKNAMKGVLLAYEKA